MGHGALSILALILHYQIRLYLNAFYSHMYDRYDKIDALLWPWNTWFRCNHWSLDTVVSFNYDLILEQNLYRSSHRMLKYTVAGEPFGSSIAVFKPHGSINFAISPNEMNVSRDGYKGGGIVELIDAPVVICQDLHAHKVLPDIVLPLEYSQIRGFQHVASGYKLVVDRAPCFNRCIIVGLSYWEHDRPEIDFVLDKLHPETAVTLVNPYPPCELISVLRGKFAAFAVMESVTKLGT